MKMIDPDRLLTQEDVAQFLKAKPKTLEMWRFRGGGPKFVRVGRLVRYRYADLQDWVAGRVRTSTSDSARAVP